MLLRMYSVENFGAVEIYKKKASYNVAGVLCVHPLNEISIPLGQELANHFDFQSTPTSLRCTRNDAHHTPPAAAGRLQRRISANKRHRRRRAAVSNYNSGGNGGARSFFYTPTIPV